MVEITANVWKNGNSYAVRIPSALFKCKVLDPSKPVRIVVEQARVQGEDGDLWPRVFGVPARFTVVPREGLLRDGVCS